MKQLLLSITALACSTLLFAQGKKAEDVAKFESEAIDLGKIKQGNPTTAKFMVANISNEPLIIEQANPTCGCTISNYTKEPIAAGTKGEINATYNAANVGAFEKRLTVKFAGVDEIKYITIKGQVLSAEEYAKENGLPIPINAAAENTAAPVATEKKEEVAAPVVAAKKTAPAAKPAVKKTTTTTPAKKP